MSNNKSVNNNFKNSYKKYRMIVFFLNEHIFIFIDYSIKLGDF